MALLRRHWLAGVLLLACARARADGPATLEQQVKAAYLLHFATYVSWPAASFARADSALLIGVAGDDGLAEQLAQMLAGRNVDGHPLALRRIARGSDLAGLHMLFVGSQEGSALATWLAAVRGQPVLTVSDAPAALAQGGMIRFVLADERLRFEVALAPVAAGGLRVSARMLAVARRVQGA